MNCQKGISLWNKEKKLIPGGTQLLSKGSEMLFPEYWLSYYKKEKGVELFKFFNIQFI